MSLQLDPELVAVMAPMAEALAARPQLPAGDVAGRRQAVGEMSKSFSKMFPDVPEVTREDHAVQTTDGAEIIIAEFRLADSPQPSKAVYYIHGGGMIMGSVDLFQSMIKMRVKETGIPAFAVGYRLAPEHKHPIPVNDCWAGLQWLSKNAASFGIDPARIVLMGESAGGGLAGGSITSPKFAISANHSACSWHGSYGP